MVAVARGGGRRTRKAVAMAVAAAVGPARVGGGDVCGVPGAAGAAGCGGVTACWRRVRPAAVRRVLTALTGVGMASEAGELATGPPAPALARRAGPLRTGGMMVKFSSAGTGGRAD
jgi:hypothetical protein